MKRMALLAVFAAILAAPGSLLAESENHVEVGAFAQYCRFDQGNSSAINFVGVGGVAQKTI